VLKEKRPLEIVLPADYKTGGTEKYDVLYTTDGEYTTRIVSSFAQFLGIQFIPANIVISIPNTSTGEQRHRERDMLPTHAEGVTESGGAANFLAFIRDELMPYINKKYRSSGMNTLYGSSYAGVFTMFAFLKEPHLFQSYLMADPALHWDNEYMIRMAGETLGSLHFTNTTLLMTGREGAPLQFMGVAAMDSVFKAKAPSGLRWKMNVYSDETHNSMIFRTVYDGLKYTYYGFSHDPLVFYPANGTVLKGHPLKILCNSDLMKEVRYTTDGSEPTRTSAEKDGGFITLTGAASLKVKAFCNRDEYSKIATGSFKEGESLPAGPKPKNAKPGGFSYSYYEGAWDSLPDFKKLKPVQSGLTDSVFDIHKLPHQNNFACLVQGWLEVKEDGYYLFGFDCAGGARLSLDKQVLIDYNGLHEGGQFQTYTIPLVKGFYPFRLEYFQKQGSPGLQIAYILPGSGNPDNIPFSLQYNTAKH
jgi:predicted alpha/beta superfamily hydrolase